MTDSNLNNASDKLGARENWSFRFFQFICCSPKPCWKAKYVYHLKYMWSVYLISVLSSDLIEIILFIGFEIWWNLKVWVSQVIQRSFIASQRVNKSLKVGKQSDWVTH